MKRIAIAIVELERHHGLDVSMSECHDCAGIALVSGFGAVCRQPAQDIHVDGLCRSFTATTDDGFLPLAPAAPQYRGPALI